MTTNLNLNFVPPLDPGFQPAVLFNRYLYRMPRTRSRARPCRWCIGLERESGLVSRFETVVRPGADAATLLYVERIVKFLFVGARRLESLHFGGPKAIGEFIRKTYSARGARKFDCDMMGTAYGKKFQVVVTTPEKVPANREMQVAAGGHLKGCRIGFDLGASDYKVSAVDERRGGFHRGNAMGRRHQATNPEYHYHHISAALHRAAAHLPRVDAIGGSSAGIIVDNEIRVASLLRAIPKQLYPQAARVFKRIQQEWNVPVVVMNDGDVTALAGALSLRQKGMLGIAMGSSEAAGFMDSQGRILGWLNELAFAPVDYNPNAATDEWSGDKGVGALYFSQQAVNKLLSASKIKLPAKMGLPERLKEVQTLMAKGDAAKIYETIGVYFGYAIAYFTRIFTITGTCSSLAASRPAKAATSSWPRRAKCCRGNFPKWQHG